MNSSVTVAIQLTLDDLAFDANESLDGFSTPLLKLQANARQYYDTVCVPLSNERWRERWRRMCLSEGGSSGVAAAGSSSKNDSDKVKVPEEPTADAEAKKEADRIAEQWRANPSFKHDEVTMTRLGESCFLR